MSSEAEFESPPPVPESDHAVTPDLPEPEPPAPDLDLGKAPENEDVRDKDPTAGEDTGAGDEAGAQDRTSPEPPD
ncbi:hypothetical protein ACWDYJ_26375 [Streptomyces sp. NPDC003042]